MRDIDPIPQHPYESEISDYSTEFSVPDRRRLIGQGALHYLGQIAGVLSSLVLVPLMLARLGAEAYGLWIVALAAPGFVTGLDNALYLSISRETASHQGAGRIQDEPTSRFLSACCGAYVSIALLSAVFVVGSGALITGRLHLSPALRAEAGTVFAAVAVAYAAGRAVVFGNAVLSGFQRFGTINGISVSVLAVRFFCFVVLLALHTTIAAIAVCHALLVLVECVLNLGLAHRLGALRLNSSLLEWGRLQRVGEFGITSFATTLLQNFCWFSPPVLLGILTGGTASTTALYAGQRPCFIVSELNWRGAEVLFSASAAQEQSREDKAYSELMLFGMKCVLAVALPLCIGLFVLAPEIVHVWLRIARPDTATVMRLTVAGVIADALWVAPLHVLWGRGRARRVLVLTAAVTASVLLLNVALIPRWNATGVAAAFAVSAWIGAIAAIWEAGRETHSSGLRLLVSSFSEVAVPAAGLAIFAVSAVPLLKASPRSLLLTELAGGAATYATLYWLQHHFRGNASGHAAVWLVRKFRGL